ncbi:putative DNA modification/repair radical SAM protein [Geomobilimonas luticola]|uniref:DNA modification/repair radical SAM protein n=1 Tax=Geomobilimonas luticola TaxID=1114878 RepID=A0ABS5SET6_9BACT|nr:putative DNA modification/repair radical SAM protein [Geomobilimonas luticola]MBT0653705.1 putative DNA modification/repair radical SAM protein [Geomobilimonas luticola]
MDLEERLGILAENAKYDVSCASSGSRREGRDGIGNAASCGICHSWTSDGRCVSLLKILLTNACIYDCSYCINRRSNDVPRAALTPEEVAELTIGFYRRNYIEGLFLSTGVVRGPDHTMELLIRAARLLRETHRFNGYIHLKLVPGADPLLVEQAGRYADRVSMNIELPTRESLKLLAPDKNRDAIVGPMRTVSGLITRSREERRVSRKAPLFAPAGQSTQLIVGATPESDLQIIRLAEGFYNRLAMKRVYYSAFIPVGDSRHLPALPGPPLLREHRLYQADWLLRYYGFAAHEVLDEARPDLDLAVDPKCGWALRHLHLFPVEVNRAAYEVLLRVPGIGVRSAKRIVRARRQQHLSFDDLAKLGVVLKRARFFLTARGKRLETLDLGESVLRALLTAPAPRPKARQLSLFDGVGGDESVSVLTGEL